MRGGWGAETTASQAKAAAAVFEAAQAATVHPLLVASNRTELVSLVNSNLLGLNAPAIAAVESEYEQIWAQDVAAMSSYYGGASAVAAQLTPWQGAQQTLPGPVGYGANAAANPLAALSLNLGIGNTGIFNLGNGNTGILNLGSGDVGAFNIGAGNSGPLTAYTFGGALNVGFGNYGSYNIGVGNGDGLQLFRTGYADVGIGNIGMLNVGIGNAGVLNIGFGNGNPYALDAAQPNAFNVGGGNLGSSNVGFGNLGDQNIGLGNSGNND